MTFWMTLTGGIGLCLEAGTAFRVQENFFSHRMNRYTAFLSVILLYPAVNLMAGYLANLQSSYLFYSVLRQSCLIFLLVLFFHGTLWSRAAMAAILCASFEFTLNAVEETLSLFGMFLPQHWQTVSEYLIYLCYPCASVILWQAFRHMKLRPEIFTRQGCRLLFFIMCGLMLLTDIVYHGITHGVILIFYIGYPEVFNSYMSEILTHTDCIILSILSLAITLCLPAGLNRIIQHTVSEQIHSTQAAHYRTLLDEYKKQTSLRHDLKNHMIVLNRLAEQGNLEQISQYLKTMYQETYAMTGNIRTGNMTADAVIDIKEQAAREKNILLTCELNLPGQLSLEDFDLCIVLGNLLDNAIHATSRIPEMKNRRIIMRAETVRRNLVLEIKNPIADEAHTRPFNVKDYGTGLHNVNAIIEKHNGVMDISLDDSLFCVSILLPFGVYICHI